MNAVIGVTLYVLTQGKAVLFIKNSNDDKDTELSKSFHKISAPYLTKTRNRNTDKAKTKIFTLFLSYLFRLK